MPFLGYRVTALPKPRVLLLPIHGEFKDWHRRQFNRDMKADDWERKPSVPLEQGGFGIGELQWKQLLTHILHNLHGHPTLGKFYKIVQIDSGIDKNTYQAPLSITPATMLAMISDAYEHSHEPPIS
jgi:hypothetical protein